MNARNPYLSFVLCIVLLTLTGNVLAQQTGIRWTVPATSDEIDEDLDLYLRSGFDIVEVNSPVTPQAIAALRDYGFEIWLNAGPQYLTFKEISESGEQIGGRIALLMNQYNSDSTLTHIGLITDSQTEHPASRRIMEKLVSDLSENGSKTLYFTLNKKLISLNDSSVTGQIFIKEDYNRTQLPALSDSLDRFSTENKVLFLNSGWYTDAVVDYPDLPEHLFAYSQENSGIFPLPEIRTTGNNFRPSVVLLILLWGVIAYMLKYIPTYRQMLLRYFTAHQFYVDDIIQYRERSAGSGAVMLLVHAVTGGLIFTIAAESLLSEASLAALFHHAPALTILGEGSASVFADSFMLIILVQIIALLWLYLPNKEIRHFSQIINLYSWLFHLDIILATFIATFYLSGSSDFWILSTVIVYILIWFVAFNITAFDASRALISGKNLYFILTIGLHSLISIGVLILSFTYAEIWSVIDLIFYLS
ncbi:hypothetical protein AB2B38_012035 [Balneola sp. MJW-20]|uniref:hypothetical protein n=1 Tax=Gracilimonas aurantiaca TaxID=3234185 RepID=UPI003467E32D